MHAIPQFLNDPDANQFREMCWGCGSARAVLVVAHDDETQVIGGSGAGSAAVPSTRTACPRTTPLRWAAGMTTVRCFRRNGWRETAARFAWLLTRERLRPVVPVRL